MSVSLKGQQENFLKESREDPAEDLGRCQVRDTGEAGKRTFPESRWLAADEGHRR